jgi:hypothetical protein
LCLEWKISKSYSIASTTKASIFHRFLRCQDEDTNAYGNIGITLFVIVIIVSFICGVANLVSLFNRLLVFINLRRKGKIQMKKIFKYLHWWYFVAVVANVCNVVGIIIIYLGINTDSNTFGRTFAGIGVFLTVITFIRHYYLYKRLYVH